MNNRLLIALFALLAYSVSITSCKDFYSGIEQVKTDSNLPDRLTVDEVIPKMGALEIHFSYPKGNPNIAQAIASYIDKNGKKVDFKVSRYSSSVLVEGLYGTDEVTIELVCVDNSGNVSDITFVTAAPLISPVELAMQTLVITPAFGGVKVEWQNLSGDPFAIHVLTEDSIQKGVVSLEEDLSLIIYTKDTVNTFAYLQPFPSEPAMFGFFITDKWGNFSDTLMASITPFHEVKLDYELVEEMNVFNLARFSGTRDWDTYGFDPVTGIQNDGNTQNNAGMTPKSLFDGKLDGNQYFVYKYVINYSDLDPANHIQVHSVFATFDLNVDIRLSRILVYPRPAGSAVYGPGLPVRFRIWGTTDDNVNRFNQFPETWTLIGEYCFDRKPVDINNITQEEMDAFLTQQYMVDQDNVNPDAEPLALIRYMRLEYVESYFKASHRYYSNEMELFGDIEKFHK